MFHLFCPRLNLGQNKVQMDGGPNVSFILSKIVACEQAHIWEHTRPDSSPPDRLDF